MNKTNSCECDRKREEIERNFERFARYVKRLNGNNNHYDLAKTRAVNFKLFKTTRGIP